MTPYNVFTDESKVSRLSNSADNRAFFDAVQEYFLERTGKGLLLSSRDLELLIGWRQSGATASTVCQGIDAAMGALRKAPRDLHAVKRFVDPRLTSVSGIGGNMGIAPRQAVVQDDPWSVALERISAAKSAAARSELASSYLDVTKKVGEARDADSDPWSVLSDLDDWLVHDVFGRLAEDERRLIDLEIEGHHGAHLSVMAEDAREQTMLNSRRRALEKRFGLISLVE